MSPKEPQSRCVTPRARPKRVWGRGTTLSVCVHACVSALGRERQRSQNKRRDAVLFRRFYFRIVEEKTRKTKCRLCSFVYLDYFYI